MRAVRPASDRSPPPGARRSSSAWCRFPRATGCGSVLFARAWGHAQRAGQRRSGSRRVIEDLHWADSVTLDLLDYLLASPALGVGIPIVGSSSGTARPPTVTGDPGVAPADAGTTVGRHPRARHPTYVNESRRAAPVTTRSTRSLNRRRSQPDSSAGGLATRCSPSSWPPKALDGRDADVLGPRRLAQLLGQRLAGRRRGRLAHRPGPVGVADRAATPAGATGRCPDRSGGGTH